jgi:hypothetical protein
MPAFGELLLVGWTRDRVMTQWLVVEGPVAQALRDLATTHRNGGEGAAIAEKATP